MIATFPALAAHASGASESNPVLASLLPELPSYTEARFVPAASGKQIMTILEAFQKQYSLYRCLEPTGCLDVPWLLPSSFVLPQLKPIKVNCFEDDGDNFWLECVTNRKTPLNEVFFLDNSGRFFNLLVNYHWIAPWAAVEVINCLKALIKNHRSLLTLDKREFLIKDFAWHGNNGDLTLMAMTDPGEKIPGVKASELFYPSGQALLGHLIHEAGVAPWSIKDLAELPDAILGRGSKFAEAERSPVPIIPGGIMSQLFALRQL